MKLLITIASLMLTTQSYAATVCSGTYAAGIGHVLKGESRPLGNKETIKAGEISSDSLYTLSFSKDEKVTLSETASGKAVALSSSSPAPDMQIYSTGTLRLYPSGVPGTDADHKFVVVMCTDEGNL